MSDYPDFLFRELHALAWVQQRDEDRVVLSEAAAAILRLHVEAEAARSLAAEFLADTLDARTLFIECHAVWSNPAGGGERAPLLETLDEEERKHLAVLDDKIARAIQLIGDH